MRELKRKIRVEILRAKKDPIFKGSIWILTIHAAIVAIYATITILTQ